MTKQGAGMTRATLVKKARKDIWSQGAKITKTHEAGKHKGETYDTYDTSVKGSKDDVLLIAKVNLIGNGHSDLVLGT
jgi:hypothetical protein